MTPKLVAPAVEGTCFSWRFGETVFQVDAARGARITRFGLGGDDILTGPEVNPLNFGSTFWTSPQSQWGWPPPVAIDSQPYQAAPVDPTGRAIRMSGQPDPQLGISVAKTFSVNGDRGVVTIDYALCNHASESRPVAPWEISRHPTGGLTFFPADAAAAAGPIVDPRSNLAVIERAGAVWFDYDANAISGHQKLFARGDRTEGWIAHVDGTRRLLLVKTFPPLPVPVDIDGASGAAPGEAAIELYADPNHTYIEIEQQGSYEPLAPGATRHWTVTWRLRRLPRALEARVANPELLAAARSLAAR